jgi:hypothetical protein
MIAAWLLNKSAPSTVSGGAAVYWGAIRSKQEREVNAKGTGFPKFKESIMWYVLKLLTMPRSVCAVIKLNEDA